MLPAGTGSSHGGLTRRPAAPRRASTVAPNERPKNVWHYPNVAWAKPGGTRIEYVLPCPWLLIRSL